MNWYDDPSTYRVLGILHNEGNGLDYEVISHDGGYHYRVIQSKLAPSGAFFLSDVSGLGEGQFFKETAKLIERDMVKVNVHEEI